MLLPEILVYSVFVYLAIGFVFALYFVFFSLKDFDESAKEAGIGFKLIIFFGVVAFWALFASRMLRGVKRPTENNAHRRAAKES